MVGHHNYHARLLDTLVLDESAHLYNRKFRLTALYQIRHAEARHTSLSVNTVEASKKISREYAVTSRGLCGLTVLASHVESSTDGLHEMQSGMTRQEPARQYWYSLTWRSKLTHQDDNGIQG